MIKIQKIGFLKIVVLLFALFLLTLASVYAQTQQINPDNSNLHYIGRVDFSNQQAPLFTWPGISVHTRFTGTSLKVLFEGTSGSNYYQIMVDGNSYIKEITSGEIF